MFRKEKDNENSDVVTWRRRASSFAAPVPKQRWFFRAARMASPYLICPRGARRRSVLRALILSTIFLATVAMSSIAFGQETIASESRTSGGTVTANGTGVVDLTNPGSIIENASRVLEVDGVGVPATEQDGGGMSSTLSILAMLTVLTLAPSILILMTSFTRIVVVLALLRQAIGTQSLPPTQVLVGLSLFMTFLVMGPTFSDINKKALIPLQKGEMTSFEAWETAKLPIRKFMFDQIDYADNWDDLYMILEYKGEDISNPAGIEFKDVDMLALVPAFVLSELKVAFLMGFRLYLPFLIVDMVIASVLISMGMLMLPPVLISLPFKLLLFVLVDGWHLVAGNLLTSFAVNSG